MKRRNNPKSKPAKTGNPPTLYSKEALQSQKADPSKIHQAWHKDFQFLSAYRRRNPNKWPSRDSKSPDEVRLANWIRSNLELLAADRLPPAQMRMIQDLIAGTYKSTKKHK